MSATLGCSALEYSYVQLRCDYLHFGTLRGHCTATQITLFSYCPSATLQLFISADHCIKILCRWVFAGPPRKCGANEICVGNCSYAHFEYPIYYISFKMRFVRLATTHSRKEVRAQYDAQTIAFKWTGNACRFILCDVLIMRDSCFRWNSRCYLFTCLLRRNLSSVNCNAVRMRNQIEILFFLAGWFLYIFFSSFFCGFHENTCATMATWFRI